MPGKILVLVASAVAAAQGAPAQNAHTVNAWRSTNEAQIIRKLADYTAVQSIADNPAGLRSMATTLRDALAERGFEARLLELGPELVG